MPTLFRGANFRVTMYSGDHNPPHFHIVMKNREAQVAIADCRVLRGSVPAPVLKAATAWAQNNRPLLVTAWKTLQPR